MATTDEKIEQFRVLADQATRNPFVYGGRAMGAAVALIEDMHCRLTRLEHQAAARDMLEDGDWEGFDDAES